MGSSEVYISTHAINYLINQVVNEFISKTDNIFRGIYGKHRKYEARK